MLSFKNKKIGIWGFGLVGQSALKFFNQGGAHSIHIMERTSLSSDKLALLNEHKGILIPQTNPEQFFDENDLILPSPGIDIRPYLHYQHKFITELDILQAYCNKPIIAITGTIAKTTVTHTLGTLLNKKKSVLVGGNIGIAMLDLLNTCNNVDALILEVSSFQLEFIHTFAPQLAIWTTFYPNHLDRHSNADEYFSAKYNLLKFQQPAHQALLPLSIAQNITMKNPQGSLAFFSEKKPLIDKNLYDHQLFWVEDNYIMHYVHQTIHPLLSLNDLPSHGFLLNWLIIVAALKLLEQPLSLLNDTDKNTPIPLEHRLEWCGSINGIDFYNDSKSTIMESTLAAVNTLSKRPIILMLGGLSKGVDRKPYYEQLKNKVRMIICFGKEAEQLAEWGNQYSIPCHSAPTLQEAFNCAIDQAKAADQILLSPGGSSYDLFADYKERGTFFKNLVQNLIATKMI